MPMSPHEAATMLGVPHTADPEAVEAAIAQRRADYALQMERAATPEIATYWRNRLGRLDEAREVIRQAAEARVRAAAEAEAEAAAAEAVNDEGSPSAAPLTPALPGDAYARWQETSPDGSSPASSTDDRPGLPWEAGTGSAFERAVATVRLLLSDARRAFGEMRRTGGIGPPLLFSLFVGLPAATVAGYVYFLLQVQLQPAEFNNIALGDAALAGAFVMPLYVAIMYPVSLFLNAGLQHLSLLVLEKSPRPFETTFRTAAYAIGAAAVLQFIPIVGLVMSAVAQIVLNVIGLSRTHEIPLGRAAVVYFLPVVTCCACFLLIVMVGTWIGGAVGR